MCLALSGISHELSGLLSGGASKERDLAAMKLLGRVGVVTGAGRGLGRSVALELAREGCDVVAADLDSESAARTAAEVAGLGRRCLPVRVDVSQRGEVEAMVQATLAEMGRLDILVNNAGIKRDGLVLKMSEEDWDRVLDVNLKGVFLCTRAAAGVMREQRFGRVINISSKGVRGGNIGQANYMAAKAGILGFTLCVALEFAMYSARDGADLTCNSVLPGLMETPMSHSASEAVLKRLRAQIPLGRMGKPEEVARAVAFLAAPEASYITGAALGVDGGLFMTL